MKKIILLLACVALVPTGCSEDSATQPIDGGFNMANKVMLLKVDYLTNTFEGAKELEFDDNASFTITSEYNSPGDFGDVSLYYGELNQPLFKGTIVWAGTGHMTFPLSMINPEDMQRLEPNVPMPPVSDFEKVMYDQYSYYPDVIDHEAIWNSIDDIVEVKQYRQHNPTGKVYLFLYTPSVGYGNPAEWDWYVILKN